MTIEKTIAGTTSDPNIKQCKVYQEDCADLQKEDSINAVLTPSIRLQNQQNNQQVGSPLLVFLLFDRFQDIKAFGKRF